MRKPSILWLGLVLVAALPAEAKVFKAGAAAVDVTPPRFPISSNGQMHDQIAKSAFDRLHARALVLDDGDTQIAIVVVDSCMIPRSLYDDAKGRASRSTGIAVDHMMMSATHTHTAPAVIGAFQTEPDAEYVAFLTTKIAEAVEQAHAAKVPARVGWGVGSDPTQVFCRRWLMKPGTALTNPFGGTKDDQAQMHPGHQNPNAVKPTGPVDPEIGLLSVQTPDGKPIAVLANYAMHYAGYGIPAGTVSADYFGRFADKLKALAAPDNPAFVAILSNGPCAETHCYDYSKQRKDVTIETVSDSVSRAAFEGYKAISYHDHVPLRTVETRLRVPLRLPDADEVKRAREVLDKAKGRNLLNLGEIYARETVLLSEGPREHELILQAFRIGDLGIGSIPNEVYAETGLAIKEKSPLKPTFVIELANGGSGYIPPPEQFPLGGYTTWRARSSCLEVGAEPKIRAAVLALLDDVASAKPKGPAAAKTDPPKGYLALKTSKPIVIDGKLDDADWANAGWTDDFVDIEGDIRPRPTYRTHTKMLWDDTYFYFAAELTEPNVWATLTKHDAVIFQDNDFEIFIDPDGDNHAYYEVEINALATEWDLFLGKPYRNGGPAVNEWEIPGLKAATHVNGTINDPTDKDESWTVEFAIPWKVLAEHANRPSPPKDGDQWRVNFSRVEWDVVIDGKTTKKLPRPEHNWVWSPQGAIDMHRPERWGFVQFSTGPPGRDSYTPDGSWPLRDRLMLIYHRQAAFRGEHKRWAATLDDLGLANEPALADATPIAVRLTDDGYEATSTFDPGAGRPRLLYTIRHDSRITAKLAE